MGTSRKVTRRVDLQTLVGATNSLGAHIGAKLGSFHSDERTLTDELCDMFAIWAERHPRLGKSAPRSSAATTPRTVPLQVTIQKLTPKDESRRGGDFELEIETPRGTKLALFQAKVIDPDTLNLRGDDPASRDRLERQLRAAEKAVGRDLAFVLLYVPWSQLNGQRWGFGTWEQGFAGKSLGSLKSFMGASVVPLTELSGAGETWSFTPFTKHLGVHNSSVKHFSFTQIVLELASCRRGTPSTTNSPQSQRDLEEAQATRLVMSLSAVDRMDWEEVEASIRLVLESQGDSGLDM